MADYCLDGFWVRDASMRTTTGSGGSAGARKVLRSTDHRNDIGASDPWVMQPAPPDPLGSLTGDCLHSSMVPLATIAMKQQYFPSTLPPAQHLEGTFNNAM